MALKLYLLDNTVLDLQSVASVRPFPDNNAFIQGLDTTSNPVALIPVARVNAVELH